MLIMNFYTKNYHVCNYLILELQFQLVFWKRALLDILSRSCFLSCVCAGCFSIIYCGAFFFFHKSPLLKRLNSRTYFIDSMWAGFTTVRMPSISVLVGLGVRPNDSFLMSERSRLRWQTQVPHSAAWQEGERQRSEIETREVQSGCNGKTSSHEKVVPRGCAISVLRGFSSPQQPGLPPELDQLWAGGWRPPEASPSLNYPPGREGHDTASLGCKPGWCPRAGRTGMAVVGTPVPVLGWD